MKKIQLQTILLSALLLSLFTVFAPIQDSFASEITYSVNSPSTLSFRDITFVGPTPEVTVTLDDLINNLNGIATLSINDFNGNLDVTTPDFITATVIQTSSTTTVNALETGPSTHVFNGTFTVTDLYDSLVLSEGELCDENSMVCYEPDPKTAIRAQIEIPLGFSGDLTFSDVIVSDNEANGSCIYPVTGALSITGTLNVQPVIYLSYANANYTGIVAGNDKTTTGIYYKAVGQQYELITPPQITEFGFVDIQPNTIKSKNTSDGSIHNDGGWDTEFGAGITPTTEYSGEYVLAIDSGCAGGGGGGLVRPSLVVNALAGLAGGGFDASGGGGSAYSSPTLQLSNLVKLGIIDVPFEVEQMIYNHDSTVPATAFGLGFFGDFDFPLIINDKGFVLSGYETTLDTQSLQTNTPHTIKFLFYEGSKIQHFSLYMNLRDANTAIHQSDTQILYNDGQEIKVIDPNGFFESVSLTLNEIDDIKKQIVLEITFAKEMATTDMIVRSWDPFLNSFDTHILKAFEVVSDTIEESTTPTFEAPVIEELESQSIPKWIKNNAAWWSDQQISDSDFVAGIEYLIKNGIINVPGVEVGTSSATTEIPDWIQNNAGWWAESLITDGDFTEAMQWLIANGVIQI